MELKDTTLLEVETWKGFRTARASHGATSGAHYFEVHVKHLGETGHCRLGWITAEGNVQAPVGYGPHGFAYRDVDGSKVHKGLREPYGEPYGAGDVIGCLLDLGAGGRPRFKAMVDVVKHKGKYFHLEADEDRSEPALLPNTRVGFTRNGVFQGWAYEGLPEGTYFPALSGFTMPGQQRGVVLRMGVGPELAHPPADDVGGGEPRLWAPVYQLSGVRPPTPPVPA